MAKKTLEKKDKKALLEEIKKNKRTLLEARFRLDQKVQSNSSLHRSTRRRIAQCETAIKNLQNGKK